MLRHAPCPILFVAGCFALGIQAAECFPGLSLEKSFILVTLLSLLYVLAFRAFLHSPLKEPLNILVAGILVVATGAMRFTSSSHIPSTHISSLIGLDNRVFGQVTGRIDDFPLTRDKNVHFTLVVKSLEASGQSTDVNGYIHGILLGRSSSGGTAFPILRRGDDVELSGSIRPLSTRHNPGSFDAETYYGRRGIFHRIQVSSPESVKIISRDSYFFDRLIAGTRSLIECTIVPSVKGEPEKALLLALVAGDRSRLDRETNERFLGTGLVHLLAISGLQLLLVGMLLHRLLKPVLIRSGLSWLKMEISRSFITLLLLLLYMFVTGNTPSVVRAVIMSGAFMIAPVFRRSSSLFNSLGLSALILLFWNPAHLFEPGFQLSFAAVGAIVVFNPVFSGFIPSSWKEHPLGRLTVEGLITSLSASLGTLPVLLCHFGRAALASLPLNIVAVPLTGMTMASSMLSILTAWAPSISSTYAAASQAFATAMLAIVDWGYYLFSGLTLHIILDNTWFLLGLVSSLFALASWSSPRRRWQLIAITLLFLSIGVWVNIASGRYRPTLNVLFFDVGNADAAFISFPNGRNVLIDTGTRFGDADDGSRIILPYLNLNNIRKINTLIVTHADNDHTGGLSSLLTEIPVGRVIYNGCSSRNRNWMQNIAFLDSLKIPLIAAAAGDTLLLDSNVRLQVLSPIDSTSCTEQNESSVVILLKYNHTSLLFTGDATADAEMKIGTAYGALLKSDVVKVAHHGSGTSSTQSFINHVFPDTTCRGLAVISAGKYQYHGLPDSEVLSRWQNQGAIIWLTGLEGAVLVQSDGKQVTWRRARR